MKVSLIDTRIEDRSTSGWELDYGLGVDTECAFRWGCPVGGLTYRANTWERNLGCS